MGPLLAAESVLDDFLFEPLKLPWWSGESAEQFKPLFDALPEDPYFPPPVYRLRRLGVVSGDAAGDDLRSDAAVLTQGSENIMFPGRSRLFENLTPAWLACPAFRSALASFRAAAGVRPRAPVQVHAIRTLARPGASGEPAPEGVHRDGFRVLGILCVGRDGVEGAVTELHASKDGAGKGGGEAPLFREALEPGTGVLVNDRPGSGVYHYTSSVSAARPPATGTRDVLVFVV